jgi:hypothetical protein
MVLILNRRILTQIQGYVDGTKHKHNKFEKTYGDCYYHKKNYYARYGHLSLIRYYMHEGWGIDTLTIASEYGHLHIVKWYFKHKKEKTLICGGAFIHNDAIILAIENGHLSIVRYILKRHKNTNDRYPLIDIAAEHGHLKIIKYLFKIGRILCTQQAMKSALKNGYPDIVTFLIRKNLCSAT